MSSPMTALTSGRIFAACVVILAASIAAVYALKEPTAFAVVVGGTVWLAGVVGGGTAAARWIEGRKELADRDDKITELEDKLMAADQENAILSGRLEDVAEVPRLRIANVIPMQRDGGHDHLKADDDFFGRLYDDKGDLR